MMKKLHAMTLRYHGFDFRITEDYKYLYANNFKSAEYSPSNSVLLEYYGEYEFKYIDIWSGPNDNSHTEPLVIDMKNAIRLIKDFMKKGAYKETGRFNVMLNFILKNENIVNYTGIDDYTYRHPEKKGINWFD